MPPMNVPSSTPMETAEDPITSCSNWNQTTSYMSAAQPLPTKSSRSAGRNRRGVIEKDLSGLGGTEENGDVITDLCQRWAGAVRPILVSRRDPVSWFKKLRSRTHEDAATPVNPAEMPLIRLEGVGKVF